MISYESYTSIWYELFNLWFLSIKKSEQTWKSRTPKRKWPYPSKLYIKYFTFIKCWSFCGFLSETTCKKKTGFTQYSLE